MIRRFCYSGRKVVVHMVLICVLLKTKEVSACLCSHCLSRVSVDEVPVWVFCLVFSFNVSGYVAETALHPGGNTFYSLRAARDSFLLCQPLHLSKPKHLIFLN